MSVGLALGGGGLVGVAWLLGALQALERELGWSASAADTIVGTSAGALVGALLAGGISTAAMCADDAGPASGLSEQDRAASLAGRLTRMDLRLAHLPRPWPGSWRLALATGLQPRRHAPGVVMSGWMPRGIASTAPIEELVRTFAGEDWPEGPRFWPIAADYATGRRIVLGCDAELAAPFPAAVAAACAIPGIYAPVAVGDRLLVDGGICSPSNLDVVRRTDAEIVIGLNPLSSWDGAPAWTPLGRVAGGLRSQSGRRLGHEARKLRSEGRHVILLQPDAYEVAQMGRNYLSGRRSAAITARARHAVAVTLRGMEIPAGLRESQVEQ